MSASILVSSNGKNYLNTWFELLSIFFFFLFSFTPPRLPFSHPLFIVSSHPTQKQDTGLFMFVPFFCSWIIFGMYVTILHSVSIYPVGPLLEWYSNEVITSTDWQMMCNALLFISCFSSTRMLTVTGGIEIEIQALIDNNFPKTEFLRELFSSLESSGENVGGGGGGRRGGGGGGGGQWMQGGGAAAAAAQEEEEGDPRIYVRCPLCRKQTIRETAIHITSSLENAECCCCLDSPSTMVLACGHLCVCEICFQKLD